MTVILRLLRSLYDYVIVDIDKRLDDLNLHVLDEADTALVVMTADLSCLKNVRLVLETVNYLGWGRDKVQLLLNRSNAFTGISVKNAEGALKRPIEHQVVNDYRAAISALNSGSPFMAARSDSTMGRSLLDVVRDLDKREAGTAAQAVAAR
jgi:pilus assembly protein CpaE